MTVTVSTASDGDLYYDPYDFEIDADPYPIFKANISFPPGNILFVRDLGAPMPMRVIGMLLGIPESDQVAIREEIDEGLKLNEAAPEIRGADDALARAERMFSDYIDWRAKHPSDDLMAELLTAEFEDEHGVTRRLTRAEVLTYANMLAAATTRLIGWTGKVLADHPNQLRMVAEDRSLVNNVVEEVPLRQRRTGPHLDRARLGKLPVITTA